MTGRAGLLVFALMALSSVARGERIASERVVDCERDPHCVARSLAVALAAEQDHLTLQRVVTFNPGRIRVYSASREAIQAIAQSWKDNARWAVITVDGYSFEPSRSEAENVALSQRRAEKIRGYLIRYGVPAAYVIAAGHGATATAAAPHVDLSIAISGHPRSM